MTALVAANAVDRGSALAKAVVKSAQRIPNAIWTNIVARSGKAIGIGEITVLKLVLVSFVELTTTAGLKMNVASLINVLIEAVLDVLLTRTAVAGITAVEDRGMAMNSAHAVQTALEDFVVKTKNVAVRAKLATRVTYAQGLKTASHLDPQLNLFLHG